MESYGHRKVFWSSVSVNLMALITGIGYSWSSPCIPKLNGSVDSDRNPLGRPATLQEISWITSLHALGSLCGPLFTGVVSRKLGKKLTLIIFSIPQVASSIILIFAYNVTHFYISRFLLGIGTGCVFSVIPSYIGEISPTYMRGRTSMLNSVLLTAGQTLVLIIGPFVTIRTIAVMTLLVSIVFLFTCVCYVPESPYFYIMNGKIEEAKKTLSSWGRRESLDKELLEITTICEQSATEQSFKALFSLKILKKCLVISLGLVTLQSLVGNPAIVAYQQTIIDTSKNNYISGDTSVMIISIMQLIGTYLSTGLVDKWGRKQLLFVSYVGLLISLAGLGAYFYFFNLQYNLDSFFWVPFASVLTYIVFYKVGAGPLPWTLSGEIFPPSFKPLLSTLTALVMTTVNFLVTLVFPYMSVYLGMAWSMWIFAAFSVFSLFYIALYLPETKGKSLVEIQRMLLEGRKRNFEFIGEQLISLEEQKLNSFDP
uniref:Facilitated trehalose transporter Tret1-like n=2 Tax=Diabrotica virgifera virgifera TaxID=50390 RepID=A0A6P7H990_DIAVI